MRLQQPPFAHLPWSPRHSATLPFALGASSRETNKPENAQKQGIKQKSPCNLRNQSNQHYPTHPNQNHEFRSHLRPSRSLQLPSPANYMERQNTPLHSREEEQQRTPKTGQHQCRRNSGVEQSSGHHKRIFGRWFFKVHCNGEIGEGKKEINLKKEIQKFTATLWTPNA